jgi:hypothetical protein
LWHIVPIEFDVLIRTELVNLMCCEAIILPMAATECCLLALLGTSIKSEEIVTVLSKNGLPPPAKVVIDTVVWSSNPQDRQHGTLTVSLKPNRIVLAQRFASELI